MRILRKLKQQSAPIIARRRFARRNRIRIRFDVEVEVKSLIGSNKRAQIVLVRQSLRPRAPIGAVVEPSSTLRIDRVHAAIVSPHALGIVLSAVHLNTVFLLTELRTVQRIHKTVTRRNRVQNRLVDPGRKREIDRRQVLTLRGRRIQIAKTAMRINISNRDRTAGGHPLDHLKIECSRKPARIALIHNLEFHRIAEQILVIGRIPNQAVRPLAVEAIGPGAHISAVGCNHPRHFKPFLHRKNIPSRVDQQGIGAEGINRSYIGIEGTRRFQQMDQDRIIPIAATACGAADRKPQIDAVVFGSRSRKEALGLITPVPGHIDRIVHPHLGGIARSGRELKGQADQNEAQKVFHKAMS